MDESIKKFTIEISESFYYQLKAKVAANNHRKSIEQILREAFINQNFIEQKFSEGKRILTEDKNGNLSWVKF